jgi:peptide/nickel transport system substrate-binding protein
MKTRNIVLSIMTIACIPFSIIVKEKFMHPREKQDLITLAVPAAWGPLTPPEQSTYAASEILGNVFETLVVYNVHGALIPQLALSWRVSPDLREYTFTLDKSRRFSDGTYLTADIVK